LLLSLSSSFGISQGGGWLKIPLKSIEDATSLDLKQGRAKQLLRKAYPQESWTKMLYFPPHPGQQHLLSLLKQLFPNDTIINNARKSSGHGIVNPLTGLPLEIDVWIPGLKLGFEYQDESHYNHTEKFSDTLERTQTRDNIKRSEMESKGYTLIEIPYWWNARKESLMATIIQHRPDLRSHSSESLSMVSESFSVIPSSPTEEDKQKNRKSVFVMLPSYYVPGVDVMDWWMGEKFDGVRGLWNPTDSALHTKTGNLFSNMRGD
jgi:hypothetical protein